MGTFIANVPLAYTLRVYGHVNILVRHRGRTTIENIQETVTCPANASRPLWLDHRMCEQKERVRKTEREKQVFIMVLLCIGYSTRF